MKGIKEFNEALKNDAALQKQAKTIFEGGRETDTAMAEKKLVALAEANGYSVTAADIRMRQAGSGRLSEDDLETVSGGGGRGDAPLCYVLGCLICAHHPDHKDNTWKCRDPIF